MHSAAGTPQDRATAFTAISFARWLTCCREAPGSASVRSAAATCHTGWDAASSWTRRIVAPRSGSTTTHAASVPDTGSSAASAATGAAGSRPDPGQGKRRGQRGTGLQRRPSRQWSDRHSGPRLLVEACLRTAEEARAERSTLPRRAPGQRAWVTSAWVEDPPPISCISFVPGLPDIRFSMPCSGSAMYWNAGSLFHGPRRSDPAPLERLK